MRRIEGEDRFHVRESETSPCETCGAGGGQWERSIPIAEAAAMLAEDPTALALLFSRACHRCGTAFDWTVAIDDSGEEVESAAQAELVATIEGLLGRGEGAQEIEAGARRAGVADVFIENGSETERRVDELRSRWLQQ